MDAYDEQGGYRDRAAAWSWPGEYGGMRSDAVVPGRTRGLSEFGTGGGMYDVEYYTSPPAPRRYRRSPEARRWGRDSERVRAGDIMTPDPDFVGELATLEEASRIMALRDIGVVPVVEADGRGRLIGLITDRDIAVRAVARGVGPDAPVRDFMSYRVHAVEADVPLSEVMRLMEREQVRRVPVVDRVGRLVGIISQADLAVDYAGFDPEREREVEEVIERISEPGHPREPEPGWWRW